MTVSGVCLLSASSVTQRICNVRGSTQWASRVRPVRATPYYNDCGHEVVAGEKYTPSRLRIVVTFGRTTQYGTRTWIVTLPPMSFQTPPDGRPPMPPLCTPPIDTPGLEARAPRRLALF